MMICYVILCKDYFYFSENINDEMIIRINNICKISSLIGENMIYDKTSNLVVQNKIIYWFLNLLDFIDLVEFK
jgi:hypothetical protein